MWVQIYDVPIGLTWKAAVDIVSVVGKVDESVLEDEKFKGCNFMRVRVAVNVTKPLCRGRKIALSGGSDSWVSFRYERLPNLCYWCGKLTHMERECPIWLKGKGVLTEKDPQFGPWLRALTPNLARKIVVKVAGLEEEDHNVGNQNPANKSIDEEHEMIDREIGRYSVAGLDVHEQGNNVGIQPDSLKGSGEIREDSYATQAIDFDPKDPKLIIPIMVDSEVPIVEEIVTHRRMTEAEFQE